MERRQRMIKVRELTVSYGGGSERKTVLEHCSLTVAAGEHAALTGSSGCGKTTLLRCIAGLVRPDTGSVSVINGCISVVFQEPRLFPWLTAAQNIDVVLPAKSGAAEWLERTGLADAAGKYPAELSGGMRQRLNICRALAYGGDVLLLDEPLKGLDPSLRREICDLICRESAGKTLMLVTHDAADLELVDTVYEYRDRQFKKK